MEIALLRFETKEFSKNRPRSEHGDLFRFDVGGDPTVLLCNHEMATEALKREEFSGRPFNRVPTVNAIQPIGHKGWK